MANNDTSNTYSSNVSADQINSFSELSPQSQAFKNSLSGVNNPNLSGTGAEKGASLAVGSVNKAAELNSSSARIKASLDPQEHNPLSMSWKDYQAYVGENNADPYAWEGHQSKLRQDTIDRLFQNKTYIEDLGTSFEAGVESVKAAPATLGLGAAYATEDLKPRPGGLIPYFATEVFRKVTGSEKLPFGITETLEESVIDSQNIIKDLKKDFTPETQKQFQTIQTKSEDRNKEIEESSDGSFTSRILGELKKTEAALDYLTNPRALGTSVVESVPDLLTSALGGVGAGVVGRKSAEKAIKNRLEENVVDTLSIQAKKELGEELQSKATKETIEDLTSKLDKNSDKFDKEIQESAIAAAEKFGLATTAVTEGAASAREALTEVEEMSIEELYEKSDRFNSLVQEKTANDTPKEEAENQAKEELKREHFNQTLSTVAVTAALIGKATGADKLAGNLLGSTGKKVVGSSILKEGLEESAQGLVGTVASNLSAQDTIDTERKLEKGTGEAAAVGAIVGAASGGVVSGGASVVKNAASLSGELLRSIVPTTEKTKITNQIDTALKQDLSDSSIGSDIEKSSVPVPTKTDIHSPEGKATVFKNANRIIKDEKASESTKEEALLLGRKLVVNTENVVNMLQQDLVTVEDSLEDSTLSKLEKSTLNTSKEVLKSKIKKYNKVLTLYGNDITNEFQARKDSLDIEAIKQRIDLTKDVATLTDNPDSFGSDNKGFSSPQQVDQAINDLTTAAIDGRISTEDLKTIAGRGNLLPIQSESLNITAELIETFKSSEEVHNDIVNGSSDYIGMKQYHSSINQAIESGDKATATKLLGKLGNFNAHRKEKLAAFKSAFAQSVETGTKVNIPRYKTKTGVAYTNPNSQGLISKIEGESQLIDTTYNLLSKKVNSVPETSIPLNQELQTVPDTSAPLFERAEPVVNDTTGISIDGVGSDNISTLTPLDSVEQIANTNSTEGDSIPVAKYSRNTNIAETIFNTGTTTLEKTEGKNKADVLYETTNLVAGQYKLKDIESPVNRTQGSVTDKVQNTPVEQFNQENKTELSPREYSVLNTLTKKTKDMSKSLDKLLLSPKKVLETRARGYTRKKPFYYLADQEGNISEETKEVLNLTGLQWLEESGLQTVSNTNYNIASLLNIADKSNFTPNYEQYKAFGENVGISVSLLTQQLGKAAVKNLGLKDDVDTDITLTSGLENNIGSVIYSALLDNGLIDTTSYPISQLKSLGGNYSSGQTGNETVATVRVNKAKIAEIFGVAEDDAFSVFDFTDGVVGSLLNEKREPTKAVIGKPNKNPALTEFNTDGQKVPKEFRDSAKSESERSLYLNRTMHNVYSVLGDDLVQDILGYKDEASVIDALKPSVAGKNQSIKHDLSTYKAFLKRMATHAVGTGSKVFETPFYHAYKFGSQFRMNAQGSDINFQRSKFHRYMIGMEPSTVDLADPDQVTKFKLFVAQNLKRLEDTGVEDSLVSLGQFLNQKDTQQALSTLKSIMFNKQKKLTDQEKANLKDVVDQGGEETASLRALVEYAQYEQAKSNQQQFFETALTLEIDGNSNGPFNALIQFGLADSSTLNLLKGGGLFTDGTESYADYRKVPGNFDLYENVMAKAAPKLTDPSIQSDKTKLILPFLGKLVATNEDGILIVDKKGRKLAKGVVTPVTYSSGKKAIHRQLTNGIISNIYDELQKYKEVKKLPTEYHNLIRTINTIMGAEYGTRTRPETLVFKKQDIDNLNAEVSAEIGTYITDAVAEVMPSMQRNINMVTQAGAVIFEMYNAQYNHAVKKLHSELVSNGTISKNQGLSKKQLQDIEDSLKTSMPIFALGTGNVDEGVQLMKSLNSTVDDSHPLGSEIFKTDAPVSNRKGSNIPMPKFGSARSNAAPGGGPVPLVNIAGGDASTMGRLNKVTKEKHTSLNVYDARLTTLDSLETVTNGLNVSGFQAVFDYDLLGSVQDRLDTSLSNFKEVLSDLDESQLDQIKKISVAASDENSFIVPATGKLFSENSDTGKIFEINKLPTLKETIANLESFAEQLGYAASVNSEAKEQLRASNIFFSQFNGLGSGVELRNGKPYNESKTPDLAKAVEQANTRLQEIVDNSTEDAIHLDEELIAVEKQSRTKNKKQPRPTDYPIHQEVIDAFGSENEIGLSKLDGLFSGTNKVIFEAIKESLPSNLSIQKLSGDSSVDLITLQDGSVNSDKYRGITAPGNIIYLNDVDKINHGMNTESLLHELLHVALDSVIDNPNVKQKSIIKDIDSLRNSLKTKLKPKQGTSLYNALFNNKEFFAWGLSNKSIQKTLKEQPPSKASLLKKAAGRVLRSIRALFNMPAGTVDSAMAELAEAFDGLTGSIESRSETTLLSSPQQVVDNINKMNLMQVFDNLRGISKEKVTASHLQHLKDTLQNAVSKVIDPLKLEYKQDEIIGSTEEDLIYTRIQANVRSDIHKLQDAGFRMSAEEVLVYGLYSPIVDSALNEFSWDTREIRKLYKYAAENMSWENFIDQDDIIETAQDKAVSQARAEKRYNAVFGTKKQSGIDNALRNFITLAETNLDFRDALGDLETPTFTNKSVRGENFIETLGNVFDLIMDHISNFVVTKESSPKVRDKLDQLAKNIRHREMVEKSKLTKAASSLVEYSSLALNQLNKTLVQGIDKAFNYTLDKTKKWDAAQGVVRVIGSVVSQKHAQQIEFVMDTVRDNFTRGNAGFFSSLYDYAKGTTDDNKRIHKLLLHKEKMIDQAGSKLKERTAKILREEYITELSKEQETSITKSMLKTDLVSLLDNGYSLDEMKSLLSDSVKLDREIQKIEKNIYSQGNTRHNNFYVNQSKALGVYMAKGFVNSKHLLLNAESIAEFHGVDTETNTPEEIARITPVLEVLATLHAIKNTESKHNKRTSQIIEAEQARTDDRNGFVFTLDLHRQAKNEARNNLFKGQTKSIIKGYTKELTSPYKSMVTAPVIEKEELEALGYELVRELGVDPDDPNKEQQAIFVSDEGAEASYLQGGLSIAAKAKKGQSFGNKRTQEVYNNRIKNKSIESLFTSSPAKTIGPIAVPVLNEGGYITNYRYLASEDTKDTLLEKDNRFSEVLGSEFANTQNKQRSVEINNQLLEALKDQYEEDKANNNLGRYVQIRADSKEAKLQEIYKLLPREAKDKAKELFGGDSILIRNDLITDAFGYRKFSFLELIDPKSDIPDAIKKTIGHGLETTLGKKIMPYVLKGHRGLQELVKDAKELIVIKSLVVLRDNIISNTLQLTVLHNVSPGKVITGQATAYKGAEEYVKNEKRIFELNTRNSIKPLGTKETKELEDLLDEQQRNPVRELIEAGLLQTIVEDVSPENDVFSYKNSISEMISSKTENVPEGVKRTLSEITLAQGSGGHALLSKITQLSDFSARFVLYQHLTQVEGKSKDQAIQEISEAFINYDRHLPKGLQALNDVGILWFIKYFINVQKIILRAFREGPARVLSLLFAEHLMGADLPTPVDSFAPVSSIGSRVGLLDGLEMASEAHPLVQLY